MSREKNPGLENWHNMTQDERKQHKKNLYTDILAKLEKENPDAYAMYHNLSWRNMPESTKIQWAKGMLQDATRSQKIKAKCIACSNFQKEEIRSCNITTCPLHSIRPYK